MWVSHLDDTRWCAFSDAHDACTAASGGKRRDARAATGAWQEPTGAAQERPPQFNLQRHPATSHTLHFLTPMAEHDSDDESLDHGMQDPVVLRGLLECIAIGLFFSGRYLLDVLFTQ